MATTRAPRSSATRPNAAKLFLHVDHVRAVVADERDDGDGPAEVTRSESFAAHGVEQRERRKLGAELEHGGRCGHAGVLKPRFRDHKDRVSVADSVPFRKTTYRPRPKVKIVRPYEACSSDAMSIEPVTK